MHDEAEEKNRDAQKGLEKMEFTVWLPKNMIELLREESLKQRVPISDIISESLTNRYPSNQTQAFTRTATGTNPQTTHIRRVVLEVLKELGLHRQRSGDSKPKRATTMARKMEPKSERSKPEILFTDHDNGTVTDNRTGLIWLKNASCFDKTDWETAMANTSDLASGACELNDGSVAGDWRLPRREELEGLANDGRRDPALPEGHPFTSVQTSNYWSSSMRDDDTLRVWVVYINRNRINYILKTGNYCVWPVRDGKKHKNDSQTSVLSSGHERQDLNNGI